MNRLISLLTGLAFLISVSASFFVIFGLSMLGSFALGPIQGAITRSSQRTTIDVKKPAGLVPCGLSVFHRTYPDHDLVGWRSLNNSRNYLL
ncbi:hypothetical protein DLR11_19785 [Salmonella enterica subsp. salamae]|uniref:Uncharacterized protein n=1 Tax=Salmonella enterica subsp. salamae TaxID=59202 RepID=A0A5Y3V419_SALER|nr:hypothetical protein [Salmonella enterica subsp. salamae]ECI3454025.1 hypothetical protein [Salmonella enterica subsp. salamae]ECJ2327693.1 hypothetical protein [Salmonella enterica subsp. salamae]